ncbi:hypothetical protein IIA79_02105, partial [bacterium]|nr:hypothetical protein [bacterium]
LITGIPHTGDTHSYTISGLDDGTRYYVGVRAYDRPWDDNPNVDPNTNWLATTPPWQREELLLGDDLPAGEIQFLKGILDPGGEIHLVYKDVNAVSLTHVWGGTGAWNYEGENLAGYYVIDFDLSWNGGLAIAWADDAEVGLLERSGPDTWIRTPFSGTIAAPNPQVSLAMGAESALAYTQYIDGTIPVVEEHYYIAQTSGGVWNAPVPLDEENFSGRDLSLVLNPGDPVDPWTAYQRGGTSAPNRLTPMEGILMYARSDGGGGFDLEAVDIGGNAPESDCGKRVRQVLDAGGNAHLAYLDLNASPDVPLGQLKYAYYDGASWTIETVINYDLSFQSAGSKQFTWGELGLALTPAGKPAIAVLTRWTSTDVTWDPHIVVAGVWVREGQGDWSAERVSDEELAFPRDREPCVLLIDPAGTWHLFYVTASDPANLAADTIVHYYRPK